jgi:hypothetical protein
MSSFLSVAPGTDYDDEIFKKCLSIERGKGHDLI